MRWPMCWARPAYEPRGFVGCLRPIPLFTIDDHWWVTFFVLNRFLHWFHPKHLLSPPLVTCFRLMRS